MPEKINSSQDYRRVALYGGAFDPIHNGHIATIALLLNSGRFDRVIVLPSGDRPDKACGSPAELRVAMTKAAVLESFGNDPRVRVRDEHARGVIGYGAIDIIDFFKAIYVEADVRFVIGHELIKDLPTWKEADRLQREGRFSIVDRPGFDVAQATFPDWDIEYVGSPYEARVEVSSSLIRGLLGAGLLCAGLLPPVVVSFCKEKKLYGCK